MSQKSIDEYFLSGDEKDKLDEKKVIRILSESNGEIKLRTVSLDDDSWEYFGMSYDKLRIVVSRLSSKKIARFLSFLDCRYDKGSWKKVYLLKEFRATMKAALETQEIPA